MGEPHNHRTRRRAPGRAGAIAAAGLLLSGCETPRALDPGGPAAGFIAGLWWFMFWISAVIFLAVMIFLGAALLRRRRTRRQPDDGRVRGVVVVGGVVVPTVVVVALMVYTIYGMATIDDPPGPTPLVVNVTSHMWWWDVEYPQYGIRTANQIHIPTGQPVLIQLVSDDVIHSFWVPQLHGKRDMVPGHLASTWLQADDAGAYRGQCAEFCGLQHAHMLFLVVAEPPQQFNGWVERQVARRQQPTSGPLFRGQQIFLGSECVYCHTIRGTPATGTFGPDLSDIGARAELGAGTLPNNRGSLAGWIIDPQPLKPGNRMPPVPMSSQDLQLMLLYLESLQ